MKMQVALAFVSTVSLCQGYTPVDPQAYQDAADAVAAAWKTSLDQLKKAVTDWIDTAAASGSDVLDVSFKSMADQMSDAVKKAKPETALQEAVKKHHKAIVGKCLSLPKEKQLNKLTMIQFMCSDPAKNLQKCVSPQGKPELAKVWDYFNNERLRASSNKEPFCLLNADKERRDRPGDCFFTKTAAANCLDEKTWMTAEEVIHHIGNIRQ